MNELTGYLSITKGKVFKYAYALDNYLVEYDERYQSKNNCVIYFSGSGIYFPNTEEAFEENIIKKNRYEWYEHRIPGVYKHIFVRDVAKQFYVWGINHSINSMEKLIEFLRVETKDMITYTVGSSAGGYAASLVGSILNVDRIYCFSGFFSLNQVNKDIWYLVAEYKEQKNCNQYYEVAKYIAQSNAKMVYFYPALSKDLVNNDFYQHTLVEDLPNVLTFGMRTLEHGITFPKYCLNDLWGMSWEQLQKMHAFAKPPMNVGRFVLLCGGINVYFMYIRQLVREKAARLKNVIIKKDNYERK